MHYTIYLEQNTFSEDINEKVIGFMTGPGRREYKEVSFTFSQHPKHKVHQ